MDEKRKGEIAYQVMKLNLRKNASFKDIVNATRNIGNIMKEPEMKGFSKDELLQFGKHITQEVFKELMARV
ncbi:unnamed protein product [marine sediment metagenome]|uniref:Uncharacterized protein n=1 Tax=marine sediment metagenome TaxID=412755 RepID=X1KZE9_9ZZZZ